MLLQTFHGNIRPPSRNNNTTNKTLPHIILVWFWWQESILSLCYAHIPLPFFKAPWKPAFWIRLTILFPHSSAESYKTLLCHKIMSNIPIKLSGLPFLQGSRIRHTQQLRLSLDFLKGLLFFSLAFSANELHMSWMCIFLNLFVILEVILMSPYPATVSCASFSRTYSCGQMLFPQNSLKLDLLQANSYKLSSVLAELEQRPQPKPSL